MQVRALAQGLCMQYATTAGEACPCTHAGASWGGFSTANYLAQGGDFFGKIIVQYVAYFLGLYFAIGVFLDLFLLGATAYSGVTYSTSAEAFLRYVKKVHAGLACHGGASCTIPC